MPTFKATLKPSGLAGRHKRQPEAEIRFEANDKDQARELAARIRDIQHPHYGITEIREVQE